MYGGTNTQSISLDSFLQIELVTCFFRRDLIIIFIILLFLLVFSVLLIFFIDFYVVFVFVFLKNLLQLI